MSKQYLLSHDATTPSSPHITFALASAPRSLLTATSASTLPIHSTLSSAHTPLPALPAHPTGTHHLACAANGSRAISIGFAGDLRLWRNAAFTSPSAAPVPGAPAPSPPQEDDWQPDPGPDLPLPAGAHAWAPALSPDGALLALSAPDGTLHTFALPARTRLASYATHASFGLCVAATDALVATGHAAGSVYVFDVGAGRLRHALAGLAGAVRSVAFSPGGTRLAAAGDARVVALYDVASGEQVAAWAGHASWVLSVGWSPTGAYVASGGWDGKVKVWRVETGECVSTLQEGGDAVWAVQWLQGDGRGVGARVEGFATAGKGGVRFYREAAGSG